MPKPLKLVPVEPLCSREVYGFVEGSDGGGVEPIPVYDYPKEAVERGQLARELRHGFGMNLRQAASALGVSLVEAAGIERGAFDVDLGEYVKLMNKEASQ